jgi:succinate dehydrogenase/fumarate reductase cytochrome b subunit
MGALAIAIEVAILFGFFFCVFNGVRLILMDLVVGPEYDKMLKIGFGVVEVLLLIFLIVHLTTFYPEAGLAWD